MQDSKKMDDLEKVDEIENRSGDNQKSKLKGWIELAAFLVFMVVILKVMSFIVNPIRMNRPDLVNERDKYVASALCEPEDTMDVIIAGDSEAFVLASPQVLYDDEGISAYVGAQSGQRASETYLFVKDMMEKQNPKVLIIETDFMVLETTTLREGVLSGLALMEDAFPIFRYHNGWKEMIGVKEPEKYTHQKGFDIRSTVKPYTDGEYMIETTDKYPINAPVKYYISKIQKLCNENDCQLLFVTSPSPVNMTYSKHNALQEYSEEIGVPYIDFNMMLDELEIDWSMDSLDKGDHVNYYATQKQSHYLSKYLKEHYDLPDHREE